MGDAWEFDAWCTQYELSQTTKDVLVSKGFNSYRTMRKLDAATIKSLFGTKISPGQMLMLQEGVEFINPPQTPEVSTEDTRRASRENQDQDTVPQPGTSRDAQNDQGQGQPPSSRDNCSLRDGILQGGSVSADQALELLRSNPAVASLLNPPAALTTPDHSGGNYLDPYQFGCDRFATKKRAVPDFVCNLNRRDNNATVSFGGVEFVTTGNKKIPQERLTPGQYMEGSLRILRAMVTEDAAQLDTVMDYINYLIQINVFAQSFQWTNIMNYDRIYREEQFANGFRWGSGSAFLMTSLLQKPIDPVNLEVTKGKQKLPQIKDPKSGKPVCQKFNGRLGCTLVACRFAHVCMVCFADHPQVNHNASTTHAKN